MIKYSVLCIAYLHEFPEYALHLYARYIPRYAMNRRLFLIIDDHPELDYIEWECDPNELLKNMDSLGYAKGLEATEFQQFEYEDDFPGNFLGIMKTDDAYYIHRASTTGCTPWPMGKVIVKINDAYFFQHNGDPVHYIPKVEFEFYLERFFRWLKYVVCKNNDIEIIQTKNSLPQNTFKSAMENAKYYQRYSITNFMMMMIITMSMVIIFRCILKFVLVQLRCTQMVLKVHAKQILWNCFVICIS